jgi:hypothetical protein
MVDYIALKSEIDTDPLTRGYSGMTDQQVADDMNTVYRTRNRDSMTGDEIFQATDPTEYNGLDTGSGNTADNQGHWLAFCGRTEIDPFATANVQLVQSIFGGGSTTVSNLQTARLENVSRADELGLGFIRSGYVEYARTL